MATLILQMVHYLDNHILLMLMCKQIIHSLGMINKFTVPIGIWFMDSLHEETIPMIISGHMKYYIWFYTFYL